MQYRLCIHMHTTSNTARLKKMTQGWTLGNLGNLHIYHLVLFRSLFLPFFLALQAISTKHMHKLCVSSTIDMSMWSLHLIDPVKQK